MLFIFALFKNTELYSVKTAQSLKVAIAQPYTAEENHAMDIKRNPKFREAQDIQAVTACATTI